MTEILSRRFFYVQVQTWLYTASADAPQLHKMIRMSTEEAILVVMVPSYVVASLAELACIEYTQTRSYLETQ